MLTITGVLLFAAFAMLVCKYAPVRKAKLLAPSTTRRYSVPQPNAQWASLRATQDYWAARFRYQETGALADLDLMKAKVTLTYPDLDFMLTAPDDPPPAPKPAATATWAKDILTAAPAVWCGGAGGTGSTDTMLVYGGDQRGSEALDVCAHCHKPFGDKLYAQGGMDAVTPHRYVCDACHHELTRLQNTAVGTSVVSRHDELAQEQRSLEDAIGALWGHHMTMEELCNMPVSEFAKLRRESVDSRGLLG